MTMLLDEELVTVVEAARLLRVNPSTVWRWINHGELPALRVGQRRVLVRRAALAKVIGPARDGAPGLETVAPSDLARLRRPYTESERARALAALEAAEELERELLAKRDGKPFSSSVEHLRRSRSERSRQLG